MTLELFTAQKIAELAFGAVVETSVGKLTEGAIANTKQLWQKIRDKLKGEPAAEAALVEIEQNHSREHLAQILPFLQVEMIKDPQFAQEIKKLAQEINTENQENITINVENPQSSPVVGKQEGQGNKIVGVETQINLGK